MGNDSCATPKPIPVPFYEESTTQYTSVLYNNNVTFSYGNSSDSNVCSSLRTDFGHNFYLLTGLPETRTCLGVSIFSPYDTSLAILTGDCASVSCLAENIIWQNSANPALNFFAEPGISYTIVVAPRSRLGGDYSIFVEVRVVFRL